MAAENPARVLALPLGQGLAPARGLVRRCRPSRRSGTSGTTAATAA
jgi:hypothetical protein